MFYVILHGVYRCIKSDIIYLGISNRALGWLYLPITLMFIILLMDSHAKSMYNFKF